MTISHHSLSQDRSNRLWSCGARFCESGHPTMLRTRTATVLQKAGGHNKRENEVAPVAVSTTARSPLHGEMFGKGHDHRAFFTV